MQHVFPCGVSRSGTTLLTTILDSHPQISMGYELLPSSGLPDIARILPILEDLGEDGLPLARPRLLKRDPEMVPVAKLILAGRQARANRLHIAAALRTMQAEGVTRIDSFERKVHLALALAEHKRKVEGTALSGFKLNTSRFADVEQMVPGSGYVLIVRDPRDVVASQLKRGFDRSVPEMALMWSRHLRRFRALQRRRRDRMTVIRYEDLVTDPEPTLERIFTTFDLPVVPEVRHFYESSATIHQSSHNNAKAVAKDFFSTSIGRWQGALDPGQVRTITRACRSGMRRLDYS